MQPANVKCEYLKSVRFSAKIQRITFIDIDFPHGTDPLASNGTTSNVILLNPYILFQSKNFIKFYTGGW